MMMTPELAEYGWTNGWMDRRDVQVMWAGSAPQQIRSAMATSDQVVCAIDTAWSWWVWVEEEVRGTIPSVAQASHPVFLGLQYPVGWLC